MRRNNVHALGVGTVLMASLWAAVAGAAPADRNTVLGQIDANRVEQQAQRLEALFATQAGFDDAAVLDLLSNPALPVAEREWLIQRFLVMAREVEPGDAMRRLVRSFLSYRPQVLVAHEEGGPDVALFAIPTVAQGTLNRWTFDSARGGATAAFERGEFGFLTAFTMESDPFTRPVKAGLLAALADVDAASLAGARDWLLAHEEGADFGEPLGVIATRTGDAALFEHVLTRSKGPVVVRMISAAGSALPRDEAVAVLSACLSRDDISSAALFGLGRLTAQSAEARNIVLDRLADPTLGATAATVIARSGDPQMLDQAAMRLAEGGLTGRRALLALRLNDSPAARSYARDYLDSGDDARLKSEVATWLEQ